MTICVLFKTFNRDIVGRLAWMRPLSLSRLLPTASQNEFDLITQMLQLDPSKRITIDEALNHPYLSVCHYVNFLLFLLIFLYYN